MKIWQHQPKPDSNTLVKTAHDKWSLHFQEHGGSLSKFSSVRSTRYIRTFQKVGGILIFNFVLYINKRHFTKSLCNTKGKLDCFLQGKKYALNDKFKFSKNTWSCYWKRIRDYMNKKFKYVNASRSGQGQN